MQIILRLIAPSLLTVSINIRGLRVTFRNEGTDKLKKEINLFMVPEETLLKERNINSNLRYYPTEESDENKENITL